MCTSNKIVAASSSQMLLFVPWIKRIPKHTQDSICMWRMLLCPKYWDAASLIWKSCAYVFCPRFWFTWLPQSDNLWFPCYHCSWYLTALAKGLHILLSSVSCSGHSPYTTKGIVGIDFITSLLTFEGPAVSRGEGIPVLGDYSRGNGFK